MRASMENPRLTARSALEECAAGIDRARNETLFDLLREEVDLHPVTRSAAIDALAAGAFDRAALRDVHLDFGHAAAEVFSDAIVMAQYHARSLGRRFGTRAKMAARFLLALSTLDDLGFVPGLGVGGSYRGTPLRSHPLLFEAVLDALGADEAVRAAFSPSNAARALRASTEAAMADFHALLAILAVTEEVAKHLFPVLRDAAKAAGVDAGSGYYAAHAEAPQRTDLWHLLVNVTPPEDHARVREVALRTCDLWEDFWQRQTERLTATGAASALCQLLQPPRVRWPFVIVLGEEGGQAHNA
jgi:hypothetical protein